MFAATIEKQVLHYTQLPDPTPGQGEVLIDVVAAGINRADSLQIAGKYQPPPGASDIPGLEVSGRISAVAESVTGFTSGQEVVALLSGGGYASKVAVPAVQVLPAPRGIGLIEAAALPEALATVYSNIVMAGHAQAGETVLIHGGAGGIGTTAIQLSRLLGLTPITTAGSTEKCELTTALGSALSINYKDSDFLDEVLSFTEGKGVELILDVMGGSYLERNIAALATNGRLIIIAVQGGATAEINLGVLMRKRASVLGTTLRTRAVAEKSAIMDQLYHQVWPFIERGEYVPEIDRTFELKDAEAAHEYFNSGEHSGKILLST